MLLINLGIQNIVIINNKLINNCHQVSGKNGGTGGHLHFNLILLSILRYRCGSFIILDLSKLFYSLPRYGGDGFVPQLTMVYIFQNCSLQLDSRISP